MVEANVMKAMTIAYETTLDVDGEGDVGDDGDDDGKRTVYHMLVDLVRYAV